MKTLLKSDSLATIPPQIAWEAWQPSKEEAWDVWRASLLYRRAGFAGTEKEIQQALSMTPREVIDKMMDRSSSQSQNFEKESAALGTSVLGTADLKKLAAWWLHRMLKTPTPLIEKMTLFWHGHFATGAEKVMDIELMHSQNQLLRQFALGSFPKMVHGIAKDPAMLIYLDSVSNRKAHANENFARELMELFCLGEGNYTEADVQQLAKCFTGWEIRRKQFRFNPFQHDDSLKTLLGKDNIESGEAAIDQVIASPHMPRFIVRKLFRYLISEDENPTDEFLAPLAKRFVETDYSIEAVVRMILESRLMLSGWSVGRKIRSPVELIIGWMRVMQCSTNIEFLTDRLRALGQSILYPPNVKGWEGGRAWINSSTLIGRANLIYELVRHENSRFDGQTLAAFANQIHATDAEQMVRWFSKYFLAEPIRDSEAATLAKKIKVDSPQPWTNNTLIALAGLPRIHLS